MSPIMRANASMMNIPRWYWPWATFSWSRSAAERRASLYSRTSRDREWSCWNHYVYSERGLRA